MKKLLAAVALAVTIAPAQADSLFIGGIVHGNICRTGIYYSIIPWTPVGYTCWNYAIGGPGNVSTW
ncbi:hypothetical protein RsoM2USA_158 [Ralstonia phage RsoM2USA]|nr:hypothetical protein RsoM2USA_158 [Ralstonia phage RsoM2USA]